MAAITLKAPVGIANKIEIYSDTGTPATPAFTFDRNVTISVAGHPNKDGAVITIDNKIDDENFNTFLGSYLVAVQTSVENLEYIDSTYSQIRKGEDAAIKFKYVLYAGKAGAGDRKVYAGRGFLSGDTGNAEYNSGVGNYPVQITTTLGDGMSIPSNILDSELLSTPADIALATTQIGTIVFL